MRSTELKIKNKGRKTVEQAQTGGGKNGSRIYAHWNPGIEQKRGYDLQCRYEILGQQRG